MSKLILAAFFKLFRQRLGRRHHVEKRSSEFDESDYAIYKGKFETEINIEGIENTEEQIEAAPTAGGSYQEDMEYLVNQLIQNSTYFQNALILNTNRAVLNNTYVNSVVENQWMFFQRLKNTEERVQHLEEQLKNFATTSSPLITTTRHYVTTDVAINDQINALLNELLKIQRDHGIKYKPLLSTLKPIKELTFSSEATIDLKIKQTFQKLGFMSQVYSVSFYDFYEKLE
jgi:hypothetical protein